jgi:hypothetical protein
MTKTNREELYHLIDIARAGRERTTRIENLVGNILCSVLGCCVLVTIVSWATC